MLTDPRTDPPLSLEAGKPVGNIYYGACSWTDRTLIESGTFYPPTAKTATDRLAFYADVFPMVEVDATYYALPSERNAHLWVERTHPGSSSTSRPLPSLPTIPCRSSGCRKP